MRICVLQPDYSTSEVDYQYYDPVRDLSALIPEARVDHVQLNKLTTYRQLRELSKKKYDIFVNLCEGYLEWSIPSIDVIYFLEQLNLPFTGPSSVLYDPPKELMKYVAYIAGVKTPAFALIDDTKRLQRDTAHLKYPLFVKPHKAGDSLGIDENSRVDSPELLRQQCEKYMEEYGPMLVEEYIRGQEYTVMLVADAEDPDQCIVFEPVEYVFPPGDTYKTYALKTSALHPEANRPCSNPLLASRLKDASVSIFKGFGGVGYARLDFRVDDRDDIYFLDINFTCSVFYPEGFEGSADHILRWDGTGQAGFLRMIINEGIARHRRKQKVYTMKGNASHGYGICANRPIRQGEVIFRGEEMAQRIVTRRHVEQSWSDDAKEVFRKYAYPLSQEVFLLWDENPSHWAPQNHSCEPNTVYIGLDVVASRDIDAGEELTLDYATFLDEHMEPFACQCKSAHCRKWITGTPHNSVTLRELQSLVAYNSR